ncbi:MAG: esterase/lipase family protein [Methylobacter sp.]
MNNRQRKSGSVLARAFGLIIFAAFCNTATAIDSSMRADAPAQPNIECFLNWAQTFYPNLFSPSVTGTQLSSPYTYRFYTGTNTYLAVSSTDNHVYYLRPVDASPQDLGDLSAWLTESGCGAVPYPVIFIHGIASSADTWIPYRDYLVNNAGWIFGGIPAYDPATRTVAISCPSNPSQPVSCTGTTGDFYTLNFSDSQNISLDVQGSELSAVIQAVLNANPGKTKVLLISHSMGGLAAREYLQGLARESNATTTIPYRTDVAKLITVGTPHQGSFWADACQNQLSLFNISGNVGICSLLSLNLDSNSIALGDLKPNSAALNALNDLTTHPLPSTVSYVSIIGTGQPTLSSLINFEDGDGLISDTSQDLATVAGNLPLQQKSVKVGVAFGACANETDIPLIGSIGETHTCETSDSGVGAEILRDLQ